MSYRGVRKATIPDREDCKVEEQMIENKQSSDQYEQYERLPVLLKRFTFHEKMQIANIYSSQAIMFNRNIRKNKRMVLPWSIETFVMLSMEAEEYGTDNFQGRNEKKAIKMFNAIWHATSEVLNYTCGEFGFIDIFLPLTLLSQNRCQEIDWITKYRYWYMFGHNTDALPLKDIFEDRMGAPYENFLLFGECLEIFFLAQADNPKVSIPIESLKYLIVDKFPNIARKLLITREEYVELQRKYIQNSGDSYKYVYSLCPSMQYPLVQKDDDIYFPLPHLLIQSVTASLLYRVTENDNELRTTIGKEILEKYLFDIIEQSGIYQKVFPEQLYVKNKTETYSPDVLASQGEEILFLDSKSTVPAAGIRTLDLQAYENNIKIVGENISKLAKQIWEFAKYNPFGDDVSYDMKDHWGVVVVLEDSFIPRKHYYNKAREYLKLEEDSDMWKWVLNHVKVASLYEVEKISLSGYSVLDACKECFKEEPYSIAFSGFRRFNFLPTNKNAVEFHDLHQQKVDKLMREIEKVLKIEA